MSLLLLALLAAAAPSPSPMTTPVRSQTLLDGQPVVPAEAPFSHGEVLTYSGSWMGTSVGTMTMTVDTAGNFEGRPAIHLKGSASSNRAFSLVYSIRDAGESWVDPVGLYSMGFATDQSEGNIQDYQKWVMDYDRGVATRTRVRRKGTDPVQRSSKDYALSSLYLQDGFSMLYFYRAFALKVGSKLESDVFVDKKVWKLTVEAISQEKVKTPAGTFDCLKVKPTVVGSAKGDVTVWITNDEHRIPARVQFDVPLGKVNMLLLDFKEGEGPTPAASPTPSKKER
jgi:hypothetical protein